MSDPMDRRETSPRPMRTLLLPLLSAALLVAAARGLVVGYSKDSREFSGRLQIRETFKEFAATKDSYSIVLIGGCIFQDRVIPDLFAGGLRKKGVEAPSFGIGAPAIWGQETFLLVREILELRPKKLRWIILDTTPEETTIPGRPIDSEAFNAWHSLEETYGASLGALQDETGWRKVLSQLHLHWRAFFRNLFEGGPVKRFLSTRVFFGTLPRPETPRPLRPIGGFPVPEKIEYEPPLTDPPAKMLRSYRRISELLRPAGIRVAILRPPTVGKVKYRVPELPGVPVFDYTVPARYPELYVAGNYRDPEHLSGLGAAVLSRRLADDFVKELVRRGLLLDEYLSKRTHSELPP
jgi:hypothetical protein